MKLVITLFLVINFLSCNHKKEVKNSKKCIEYVMHIDDSLGTLRNHNSEKLTLSKTIDLYTNSLEDLSFSNCPPTFSSAFKSHITAWKNMKEVTDKYPSLRGEMHDLFDQIKTSNDSLLFEKRLTAIFSTWEEVELAMESYKVSE